MQRPGNLERVQVRAGAVEPGDWIAPQGEWRCITSVELNTADQTVTIRSLEGLEAIRPHREAPIFVWRGVKHAAHYA